MPTYDYQCKHCDHKFEAFQSITATALAKCPECGRRSLQRLIGAGAGIIFKGSGFYATDYRRGASANKAGGSEPGSDRSDSKESASESASTGSSSADSSD